jgi:hypothetical protein
MENISSLREEFLRRFPPLVPRNKVAALTGGLVSSKTLANKDSQGLGPRQRVKFGGKVCYPREALVEWILKQIKA